jgi:hypothetical protein
MAKYHKILYLLFFVVSILIGCATSSQSRFPTDDSRGLSRETGRAFLVETQTETSGYGLYSYLLFGSPPTDDIVRERYLQAINSYLNIIVDISKLRKYFPPNELNITYLPLNLPPPSTISAEWILDHYNYARARYLLRTLRGSLRDGPYIISTLKPLSTFKTAPAKYLFQDMSSVPPQLIAKWVKEFINQASKERYWEENTISHFVLVMRTRIEMASDGLSEVQKAGLNLKEMITLIDTLSAVGLKPDRLGRF